MKRDALVDILNSEFARKKARNPRYSLRSFSRDLEIDASNLSKILAHRKMPGDKLKEKLAARIGLSLVELEHINRGQLEGPKTNDSDYSAHGLELFEVVAGSEHWQSAGGSGGGGGGGGSIGGAGAQGVCVITYTP